MLVWSLCVSARGGHIPAFPECTPVGYSSASHFRDIEFRVVEEGQPEKGSVLIKLGWHYSIMVILCTIPRYTAMLLFENTIPQYTAVLLFKNIHQANFIRIS